MASSRTAVSPGRIFVLLKSKWTPRSTSFCMTGGGGGGGGGAGDAGCGGCEGCPAGAPVDDAHDETVKIATVAATQTQLFHLSMGTSSQVQAIPESAPQNPAIFEKLRRISRLLR